LAKFLAWKSGRPPVPRQSDRKKDVQKTGKGETQKGFLPMTPVRKNRQKKPKTRVIGPEAEALAQMAVM